LTRVHGNRPMHARLTCDERSRYVPCPFISAGTPLSFREWSSRSATIPDAAIARKEQISCDTAS
jgi:hypothetical protein